MNLSKYSATILKCSIFRGVTESELPAALKFLNAFKRSYQKNEMIFMIGDPMQYAGVVLEGTVELSFFDEGDNSVNMNHFTAGNIFGESLACVKATKSPVQMRALTQCHILFMDFQPILDAKQLDCGYQTQIGSNLLLDFARQNVFLNQKVRIMSQRKLRDKIKVFLRQQDQSADGLIHIRFNRNELAEFLSVNRSALSRELSNMQTDGILEVLGNDIRVLDPQFLLH